MGDDQMKEELASSMIVPTLVDHNLDTAATKCSLAGGNDPSFDNNVPNAIAGNVPQTLSKNKFRKLRKHEKLLQNRTLKRQKERELRKQKKLKRSIGNEEKLILAEKLRNAMNSAPKVVIDCQYDDEMTDKEKNRFAQQLRRAYSSNKSASDPLHLIFANLSKSSDFFGTCCKQNDGFAKYIVDIQEESVVDVFPVDKIVYLSPDSSNVLSEFEPDKVYVIGGLVDETTNKDISLKFSENHKIYSARLPIDEYFVPVKEKGTLKKVLTVNQVFDIVLEWFRTKDWVKAISVGLPERTGFFPKNQDKQHSEETRNPESAI